MQRFLPSLTGPRSEKKREKFDYVDTRRRRTRLSRRTRTLLRRALTVCLFLLLGYLFYRRGAPTRTHKRHHARRATERYVNHHFKPATWLGWQSITTIFAFGDSFSETGFDIDGHQPDKTNPLGNPSWPGTTANVGANYLGHMTGTFNHSFIRTYNLARLGSSIAPRSHIRTRAAQYHMPSLTELIDHIFIPIFSKSKSWVASDSKHSRSTLFVFWTGLDDLLFAFEVRRGNRREGTRESLILLQEYMKNLEKLYDHGARNFLIINIPTLEESPKIRNSDITSAMVTLGAEIVAFNGRLAFMASQFAEAHPNANVFYFDAHHMSLFIRRGPYKYPETASVLKTEGFCYFYADPNFPMNNLGSTFIEACGADVAQWYWRDNVHMTEPFHKVMARLIVEMMGDPTSRLPFEFY